MTQDPGSDGGRHLFALLAGCGSAPQLPAEDVVAALERVCGKLGYPKTIRVDQGSEFVSRDFDLAAYAKGVILDFSRPGKPTDTDVIE